LGVASSCVRYEGFIMVAINRNKVFYFLLFHSRHYMFWTVRAIFRSETEENKKNFVAIDGHHNKDKIVDVNQAQHKTIYKNK
jgi:hypothetical protein